MSGQATSPFVGRDRELAVVDAALDAMAAGRGRLLLFTGDAGIGKTRLAGEAAARAVERGARACWGRCWESGGAPAFSPWTQIVRGAAALADAETRRRAAPALVQLVPDLRPLLAAADEPVVGLPAESEPARFALFDAVAAFLLDVARTRPLVLVLDDLHAADTSSLLLLQFLARELRDTPLIVLGTWRAVQTREQATPAHMLGELARDGELLPLDGLARDDTGLLVASIAGERPPDEVIASLHRITGGNPFFLDEVVRVLRAEGSLARPWSAVGDRPLIPDRVRAVVRRRLEPLSGAAIELLTVAAVLGQDVDLSLLQRALGRPGDRLLAVLDECLAADLWRAAPGGVGSYRFAHALIRETLYDDLPSERRARLHAHAADVLEAAGLPNQEAALANHLLRAVSIVPRERVVQAATRAARRAMGQLAFEEALALVARALELSDAGDATERGELELLLAEAARASGDAPRADEALARAASLARRAGSATHLARAVLASAPEVTGGAPDRVRIELIEAALDALGPGDDPLRARLLARLAFELYWLASPAERKALSDEAVAMARRLDDRPTLAYVLGNRRFALWAPEDADDRFATTAELLRLAAESGDRVAVMEAQHWQLTDLLETGDVAAANRVLAAYGQAAEAMRLPRYRWWRALWRAMRLLLEGHFAAAEPAIAAALAMGERVHPGNARLAMQAQMFVLLWHTGHLEHLAAGQEAFLGSDVPLPADDSGVRCGHAWILAELGWTDETRRAFEALAQDDFAALRPYVGSLTELHALAEVCVFLGDADRAAQLHARLVPHAGRVVVVGPALACMGPVSRVIGTLSALMGRYVEAEGHLAAALVQAMRMGSPPFVARTQYDWATVLLARGEQGDRNRARAMANDALATARRLGMTHLAAKVTALLERIEAEPTENVFRLDDGAWDVAHGGRRVRVRDMAGLRHLAVLLRRPHVAVHALELAVAAPDAAATVPAQWRTRLDALADQLDDAERTNDAERAAALRRERQRLVDELARAAGVGRAGRRGSPAERARINVTRAIQAAIARLETEHPALAEHLRRTVRTGTLCTYEPDARVPIAWSA